jgi:hypothetical protein
MSSILTGILLHHQGQAVFLYPIGIARKSYLIPQAAGIFTTTHYFTTTLVLDDKKTNFFSRKQTKKVCDLKKNSKISAF